MNTGPLGEILRNAVRSGWSGSLCVQAETYWDERTPAQVVKTDRYTSEPTEPVAPGLVRIGSTDDVSQVFMNAKAQLGEVSVSQLVEALRYHLAHDAFITFKKMK